MTNFRRHAETEISFSDEAQLVLLSGRNGAGKTTVLEAIRYALYGTPRAQTGRNGRAKLEDLVRRGADIEGMTVELDFTINGQDYTITRRYDSGNSYALLETQGNAITTGASEVTTEVSHLFGMDRVGFDLAVYASQSQLDGLAALSAATRGKTISRLLRLDAITKAQNDARSAMSEKRTMLKALGDIEDVAVLDQRVADAETAVTETTAALEQTRSAVQTLEKELEGSADIQAKFREANDEKARAEGWKSSADREVRDTHAALQELRNTTVTKPQVDTTVDLDSLMQRDADLERQLNEAKETNRLVRDRALLSDEITSLQQQKEKHETFLSSVGGVDGAVKLHMEAETALRGTQDAQEQIREQGTTKNSELAVAQARISELRDKLAALDEVGAVCESCGQEVSDEHRGEHESQLRQQIQDSENAAAAAESAKKTLMEEFYRKRQDATDAAQHVTTMASQLQQAKAAETAVAELSNKLTYQQRRVKSLPTTTVDETVIASERASVSATIRTMRSAEKQLQAWEKHESAIENAELRVESAKHVADKAARAVEDAQLPTSLVETVEKLSATAAQLADEKELAAECSTAAAIARQTLATAKEKRDNIKAEAARRAKMTTDVEINEAAARLLAEVESAESANIRPSLEGAVSSILSMMSEGRFDAVKILKDYSMKVRDDGALRPLSELSGGEQQLAALALRLGLASVVSARHGATNPGFLVLDEVFGAQDVGRRESIMAGLRALKATYPQILLVSHIEGTEDTVDSVLQVERVDANDEDDVAESVVTAG